MMNITIKPMETDEEIRGKAYVHWKSWQEAYAGIVDSSYLEQLTVEKCGFRMDGKEEAIRLGSLIVEVRMRK